MKHDRPITPQDAEILQLARAEGSRLGLARIFLNGQPRLALVLSYHNEAGPYVRVVGVLLDPDDLTQGINGLPATVVPPSPRNDRAFN